LSPQRFCLLLTVSLLVVYTFAPFEFAISSGDLGGRIRAALDVTASSGGVFKVLGHFVAFFTVGVLIVAVSERLQRRPDSLRWFWLIAVVFCVGLEFIQLFDQSRHARLTDLLCNVSGLILGTTGSVQWNPIRELCVKLKAWLNHHTTGFLAGVLVLASGAWLIAGLRPVVGSLKMDWSENYRLFVANESDGSRPWLGEIRYIGLYGRALTPSQVRFAREHLDAPRDETEFNHLGLLAGYDFTQAGATLIIPNGLLSSGDLAIQIPEATEWARGGGIQLRQRTMLASRKPAFELAAAMQSSGAFSVEAWVRPLNESQGGPSRIVSLSDGIWRRDFTLAQERADAVFRVRNSVNGPNGQEHELKAAGAIRTSLEHLVAVYDHGASSLFVDGKLATPVEDLREPLVYLLLGTGALGRAAGALLLTVTVTLPSHYLFSRWRSAAKAVFGAIGVTFLTGSLPYLVAGVTVGGPCPLNFLLWVAGALMTIYPLSYYYVGHGQICPRSG